MNCSTLLGSEILNDLIGRRFKLLKVALLLAGHWRRINLPVLRVVDGLAIAVGAWCLASHDV